MLYHPWPNTLLKIPRKKFKKELNWQFCITCLDY